MNSTSEKKRNSPGLGLTIPFLLIASFVAEVALRAVPIDRFAFRATEALYVRHVPGVSAAPLLPSRKYRNDRTYGDLSALANLRRLRVYRSEIFTTDAYGYRNPAVPSTASPPVAMLLGDSFGLGSGTEDFETLTAHLGRFWGRTVYNGSGMTPQADLNQIRLLARELPMRGSLVIYEYLERQGLPSVPSKGPRSSRNRSGDGQEMPATAPSPFSWELSRLRILANRMYRFFQNDRILPNPYARNASVRRLANGAEMLFLSGEHQGDDTTRPVNAAYWVWLERELRSDGFQLIVLLVPDKFTVYEPLFLGREARNTPAFHYLDRLERSLSSAGVPVVNLKNVFQAQAARQLPSNSYLYWLDDTHWNGHGMRIAAEEIDRTVRREGLVAPDGSWASPKPAD
jgi:acetyltransferase AlgX (SGNH hydrolase-like protein)